MTSIRIKLTGISELESEGLRKLSERDTEPKIAMRRIGRMHVCSDSVVAFEYPTMSDGQPAITRVGMAAENRFFNVINFIQLKYDETLPWGKLNIKPHGPVH